MLALSSAVLKKVLKYSRPGCCEASVPDDGDDEDMIGGAHYFELLLLEAVFPRDRNSVRKKIPRLARCPIVHHAIVRREERNTKSSPRSTPDALLMAR